MRHSAGLTLSRAAAGPAYVGRVLMFGRYAWPGCIWKHRPPRSHSELTGSRCALTVPGYAPLTIEGYGPFETCWLTVRYPSAMSTRQASQRHAQACRMRQGQDVWRGRMPRTEFQPWPPGLRAHRSCWTSRAPCPDPSCPTRGCDWVTRSASLAAKARA